MHAQARWLTVAVSMRPALRVAIVAVAFFAGRPAHGEDVEPSIELGEMKLEVTWVRSNAENEHARKR